MFVMTTRKKEQLKCCIFPLFTVTLMWHQIKWYAALETHFQVADIKLPFSGVTSARLFCIFICRRGAAGGADWYYHTSMDELNFPSQLS